MVPLNQTRIDKIQEVLDKARSNGHRPAVRDLMRAFIEPTVEMFLGSPQGKSFIKLIVRSMADAEGALHRQFVESAMPVFQALHQAMCRALPDTDPRIVLFKLITGLSTMGSMMLRMSSELALMSFSEEETSALRHWAINEEKLIDFITAGMEAN
jgi:hypothetical protein